ncbi:MAG TPA: hypothetical protein VNA19_08725 [Pyrinomonadaceae bacterium]|nr:hypothetical protein [Pyrinomonadaceae bacterium]
MSTGRTLEGYTSAVARGHRRRTRRGGFVDAIGMDKRLRGFEKRVRVCFRCGIVERRGSAADA